MDTMIKEVFEMLLGSTREWMELEKNMIFFNLMKVTDPSHWDFRLVAAVIYVFVLYELVLIL